MVGRSNIVKIIMMMVMPGVASLLALKMDTATFECFNLILKSVSVKTSSSIDLSLLSLLVVKVIHCPIITAFTCTLAPNLLQCIYFLSHVYEICSKNYLRINYMYMSRLRVTLNGTDKGSPRNSGRVRNSESERGSARPS